MLSIYLSKAFFRGYFAYVNENNSTIYKSGGKTFHKRIEKDSKCKKRLITFTDKALKFVLKFSIERRFKTR